MDIYLGNLKNLYLYYIKYGSEMRHHLYTSSYSSEATKLILNDIIDWDTIIFGAWYCQWNGTHKHSNEWQWRLS